MKRMAALREAHPNDPRLAPLAGFRIAKIASDPAEPVPTGVEWIALLQNRLPALAEAIDTVERFQGGERI